MLLIIFFMLVVAGGVVWIIQDRFFKQELFTIEEASNKVQNLYAGTVASSEKKGELYVIQLQRKDAIYDVAVSAETGDVSSLKLVKKENGSVQGDTTDSNTSTDVKNDVEVNSNTNKTDATPSIIITEASAIEIAKKQLKGEVDDVEYEKTNDGGYYLVEIDGKKEEAVFQIHAVSGKVMSVTYDD